MRNAFRVTVLSACIGAMFSSVPAVAQTAQPTASDDASTDRIVVTAQKRKEKLQDVPISMTALNQEALDSLNITSVANLQSAIPNILINNALGQTNLLAFIRGIGTANPVFSQDPAVGIYVDDVYLARAIGANSDFFDMERVEVLRGPQGTLYGSNSPAGAIKIITRKPDLTSGLDATATVTAGNYNERGVMFATNLPIVKDTMAARLAVQTASHDGWQTNLANGNQAGTLDSASVRLHVLTKLNDKWDLLVTGDDSRAKVLPTGGVNFAAPGGVDLFTTPGFNKRDFYSEMPDPHDNTSHRALTANLHGQIAGADFRSISAYRTLEENLNADGDGTISAKFDNTQILHNKQWTQEFNLSGEQGQFNWLVGALFMREQTNFFWDVRILRVVAPPLGLGPNYEIFDQTKNSWGLFTQDSWKVNDRLTLTGGLRWTQETKDFHVVGYAPTEVVYNRIPNGTPIPGFDIARQKTWSAPQWRLASDYRLTGDAMVFASAARGFRSGGYNGGARAIAEATAPPFNPEFVTTYELGAKTEWFNRRLRVNATYFQNHYKDQQVAFLAGAGAGAAFGTSTIDANMRGWEFETSLTPTKELRVFANFSTMTGDTNSRTIAFVPNAKYQGTVGFNNLQPLGNGLSWFLGGNYFKTAAYDISTALDPLRRVAAHGSLGGRVGVQSDNGRWKAELIGSNLNNDYWSAFSFNIPGLFQSRSPNAPRLISLKLTMNY
ncbi:MAG: TonB-dependent receptor [Proteobacteria bacterium]|nr:TonB-dependent receptor [Pseudomonadota bacterium]